MQRGPVLAFVRTDDNAGDCARGGRGAERGRDAPGANRAVELFAGVGGSVSALEPTRLGGGVEQPVGAFHAAASTPRTVTDATSARGHSSTTTSRASWSSLDRRTRADPRSRPARRRHALPGLLGGPAAEPGRRARRASKGVLWWQVHRLIEPRRPRLLLLENVDRLLKSPAAATRARLRDHGGAPSALGYEVEWRVVNAADYGFPQHAVGSTPSSSGARASGRPVTHARLSSRRPARAPPDRVDRDGHGRSLRRRPRPPVTPLSRSVRRAPRPESVPQRRCLAADGHVWTRRCRPPAWAGPRQVLGDILEPP